MSEVLKAIAVTAEITGTELSKAALMAMDADLSTYPEYIVLDALTKCRRELKGKLSLAAIIERINLADGRPTANEAWAIALSGYNESITVITNDEINEAMACARPIYDEGDETGARMAFRDAYDRISAFNRDDGRMPKWYASLGTDPARREQAIRKGIETGLIEYQSYAGLLPCKVEGDGAAIVAMLENKVIPEEISPKAKEKMAEIAELYGKWKKKPESQDGNR